MAQRRPARPEVEAGPDRSGEVRRSGHGEPRRVGEQHSRGDHSGPEADDGEPEVATDGVGVTEKGVDDDEHHPDDADHDGHQQEFGAEEELQRDQQTEPDTDRHRSTSLANQQLVEAEDHQRRHSTIPIIRWASVSSQHNGEKP